MHTSASQRHRAQCGWRAVVGLIALGLGHHAALLLVFTLASCAAPATTDAHAPGGARTAPPNILFIISDDHGKQAISCYGASAAPGVIATPGIDRIAREGVRFDRASVTNAICGPSRAVILTGRHSHINGFATNDQKFDGSQETFPKLLQAAGYRTEVVGKWHLGSDPTGFDHADVLVGQGDYWSPTFIADGKRVQRDGHVTDVIHSLALNRLEALAGPAREGRPFALLVQHKAPHRNWLPCERHMELFSQAQLPEPPTLFDKWTGRGPASKMQTMQIDRDLSWSYDLKVPVSLLAPRTPNDPLDQWMERELERLPADVRARLDAAYSEENRDLARRIGSMTPNEITAWKFQRYAKDYLRTAQGVDDSVGELLAALDRLGLADNTIVVYTSDQGWFLGEHGWFDKRWMYEESFRAPLLVRWPGVCGAGVTSGALVQNLDFAPTILEAAGAPVPVGMQGVSLVPLLRSLGQMPAGTPDSSAFRDAVYYRFEESKGAHTVPRHEGVATARWKLIRFLDLVDETGDPVLELYDLQTDPDEMHDLSRDPAHAAEKEWMLARLDALRHEYRVPLDHRAAP